MTFPVELHIFGRALPAHPIFEALGYIVGFQTYLLLRRRSKRTITSDQPTIWIIVGCIFGALIGSKLLAIVESFPDYWSAGAQLPTWLGGKTIVGGLVGGWIGVEIAKKFLGVRERTGDLFVFPLLIGIAIGRIGCFLTGLPDHTYGSHTNLPWAVDFGDGPRHPTQLYEIVFLVALGLVLARYIRRPHAAGHLWRLFALSYFGFRFAVEFIKPRHTLPIVQLSAIQIVSLAAVLLALWQMARTHQAARSKLAPGM
ncbi:prolipoprotein diacylglyceryl transferase [soil metagenome]